MRIEPISQIQNRWCQLKSSSTSTSKSRYGWINTIEFLSSLRNVTGQNIYCMDIDKDIVLSLLTKWVGIGIFSIYTQVHKHIPNTNTFEIVNKTFLSIVSINWQRLLCFELVSPFVHPCLDAINLLFSPDMVCDLNKVCGHLRPRIRLYYI